MKVLINSLVNEYSLSYLTFNEVSHVCTISRRCREIAEKVRSKMIQTGINAGFLYKITDSELNTGYLYVDNLHRTKMDVLSINPLLRAAFTKAKTVVGEDISSLQDLRESFFAAVETCHTSLRQLPRYRLEQINLSLLKYLEKTLTVDQFRAHLHEIEGMSIEKQILSGFGESFIHDHRSLDALSNSIRSKALKERKTWIDFTQQDLPHSALVAVQILTDVVRDFPRLFEILALNFADFKKRWQQDFLAWTHAHNTFVKKQDFSFLNDTLEKKEVEIKKAKIDQLAVELEALQKEKEKSGVTLELLTKLKNIAKENEQAWEEFHEAINTHQRQKEDDLQHLANLQKQLQPEISNYAGRLARKIGTLLLEAPSSLVVVSNFHTDLLQKLKDIGIGIHGPLRAPLKPRGLFWKVTNQEGKIGYLVGSIHKTPTSLLTFNRSMEEAFQQAGLLAVEVEQSETFVESMTTEEKSYLTQEIEALSEITQAKLVTLFQKKLEKTILPKELEPPEKPIPFLVWMTGLLRPLAFAKTKMDRGIDDRFMEMAREQNKPIEGLEDIPIHIEHAKQLQHDLTGINRTLLTKMAEGTLEELEQILTEMEQELQSRIQSYAKKWEFGLIEELENSPSSDQDQGIMTRRNHVMAYSVASLIATGKTPFCVVGCGHLKGTDSMIEILELESRHQFEQILCEEPDVPKLLQMCTKV